MEEFLMRGWTPSLSNGNAQTGTVPYLASGELITKTAVPLPPPKQTPPTLHASETQKLPFGEITAHRLLFSADFFLYAASNHSVVQKIPKTRSWVKDL